ncbi:hypothetical protein HPB47_006138, partial [Ixodes persulcatus]
RSADATGSEGQSTKLLSLWRKRTCGATAAPASEGTSVRPASSRRRRRHATRLCRDDWAKLREGFNERPSLSRTWIVCNAMLSKSKGGHTAQNLALAQGKDEPQEFKNKESKVDFTPWGMEAAIERRNERSAEVLDGIRNSTRQTLPEAAKRSKLKLINDAWYEGNNPHGWKKYWVCPIPKPGKKPQRREVLHPAQTRCRKSLGTPDSLVLIRECLANQPILCHRQIPLAVDVIKAFDSLAHAKVIDTAHKLGVQGRLLDFVKSFLSGRIYLVKTGRHRCSAEKTNEIVVPQGAVLSPKLFNLAMAPLLWWLVVVPDLAFTVHADDITMRIMKNDNVLLTDKTMQRALDTVNFLEKAGLRPTPGKARYMVFVKEWDKVNADLRFDGQKIDTVAERSNLGDERPLARRPDRQDLADAGTP